MNLARVIGRLWATQKYPGTAKEKFMILQPLDEQLNHTGSPIVAVDTTQSGPGNVVYYVTAREATFPLHETFSPVDASIVGLVDRIDLGKQWIS